ncbi:histone-lysine N-methyltransferase SETMAR [Trichonephila clavipes]|nr:histone-lysine N-methyltransferase SETMAR [Trichonephila clavipes]
MPLKHHKRFEIAGIGMYARTTLMRHELVDMFGNTVRFMDRSRSVGYSNYQILFRIDGRVVNHGDRFNSCQVIYSQFGLAIHKNDHQARRRFVEWAQNEIAVVPDFHKRILFSDEAHFWLNGYVNKQNCRIWSEANPQVYVETPLHPEKLTVWCALWAGGIGPFFKNDEGHNVTELWFQQDGATCHTARATIDLLKDTFGDRLISRFGPVNWPPRSCDLTPLDYFLWGYVKSLVYADKPQTLDHLEDNIRRVIADIRPQMLEKVIENWTSRLDYIRARRGSHMPEIIFKILNDHKEIPSLDHSIPSLDHSIPSLDHSIPSLDHSIPSLDHNIPSLDKTP